MKDGRWSSGRVAGAPGILNGFIPKKYSVLFFYIIPYIIYIFKNIYCIKVFLSMDTLIEWCFDH